MYLIEQPCGRNPQDVVNDQRLPEELAREVSNREETLEAPFFFPQECLLINSIVNKQGAWITKEVCICTCVSLVITGDHNQLFTNSQAFFQDLVSSAQVACPRLIREGLALIKV